MGNKKPKYKKMSNEDFTALWKCLIHDDPRRPKTGYKDPDRW